MSESFVCMPEKNAQKLSKVKLWRSELVRYDKFVVLLYIPTPLSNLMSDIINISQLKLAINCIPSQEYHNSFSMSIN